MADGSQYDYVWVPTLTGVFLEEYEGVIDEGWSGAVTRRYNQKGEFLKPVDLGSVGAVREFVGKRRTTAPRVYVLTQQNKPFELSMEIPVEDVDRDTLGMWETKAKEIGAKFADHVTKLTIAVMTSNPNCFDGTAFFGSTHPVNGTVQINDISATQVPALAAATAAAPTAVEMANIIMGCVAWLYTFVDEAGDPINGRARIFTIVTSNPVVYASAQAAIASFQLSQGLTNPLFAGLEMKGWKFSVALEPRLGTTTNTVFYIFRADSVVKPFVFNEEKAFEINYQGVGSYMAYKENKYGWGGKAVRSAGPGRYQHALRCTLS